MRILILVVLLIGFVQGLWPNFPRFFPPSPSSSQAILEQLRLLATSVADMQKDMKGVKDDIADVRKGVKRNEPLWQKAGATYEIAVRSRIRDVFGSRFTESSYSCQNIQQLTELCLPENFDVATGRVDPRMQSYENSKQTQLGSEILARVALYEVDGLRAWVNDKTAKLPSFDNQKKAEIFKEKLSLVQRELENFSQVNEKDQLKHLTYSRLGFFALSRHFLSDPSISGYVRELEIDCRSPATIEGGAVRIVFVEVKSGRGYKEALVQLIKRSGMVCMATQCILPHGHNYTFTTRCEIFSPSPWDVPSPEIVSACKKEAGIAHYPENIYFLVNKLF